MGILVFLAVLGYFRVWLICKNDTLVINGSNWVPS